jgi:hypothetical protein
MKKDFILEDISKKIVCGSECEIHLEEYLSDELK